MVVKSKEQILYSTKKKSVAQQDKKVKSSNLLMFYGTECSHCHDMFPLVDQLKKEEGLVIKKVEVWHNAVNAKKLAELDKIGCGGVPFLYNKKSGSSRSNFYNRKRVERYE